MHAIVKAGLESQVEEVSELGVLYTLKALLFFNDMNMGKGGLNVTVFSVLSTGIKS